MMLTALHDAVWNGRCEVAPILVETGASLAIRTHAGLTLRDLARLYGYDATEAMLAQAEDAR